MILLYDQTFEGWLSCVFEVYERKLTNVTICTKDNIQTSVFSTVLEIHTDEHKAERVYNGLKKRLKGEVLSHLFQAWLSELSGIETIMLSYACYVFDSDRQIAQDYSHAAVLKIEQINKMVHREKHRMEAFVRFQLTKDGMYYAMIEPDFNVLPLIKKHFQHRYADQCWLIYDAKRKYGIYYDLTQVITVQLSFEGKEYASLVLQEEEELYQHLWQQYFKHTNISSRKNPKLHIQHMPIRYWKYLTEKNTVLK